jgi:hypothetical protein
MTDRPDHRKFEDRWELVRYRRRRQYHVLPLDDLKPHVEPGLTCWCSPKIERANHTLLSS